MFELWMQQAILWIESFHICREGNHLYQRSGVQLFQAGDLGFADQSKRFTASIIAQLAETSLSASVFAF